MSDNNLINLKVGVDFNEVGKAIDALVAKGQARRSEAGRAGGNALRGGNRGLAPIPVGGHGEDEKEQNNLNKVGQAAQERHIAAQQRLADLYEEHERQMREGQAKGNQFRLGNGRFAQGGFQGQLDSAYREIESAARDMASFIEKLRLSVLGEARGAQTIAATPEAVEAFGVRDLMRRQLGMQTNLSSDEQARAMGMPTQYERDLIMKSQYQQNRQPQQEAQIEVQRQLNDRERDRATMEERQRRGLAGQGFGQGGSIWQQFQGWSNAIHGGTRSNTDFGSFGQFLAQHAGRTLGYAIPGIAIGMGFEELRNSLEEAEKAQRSMSELKAEFQGLGQSGQFTGFSSSIKDIASQTGVAVSEVTQLGIAMKGVYGDTTQATIATQGIAQATVTMNMGLQEAQQDLTAISQGFSDLQTTGGAAMTTIQNELLHLQDLTGVEAKNLAPGLADVASTANAAGFSSTQTASMLAAAAQHSGLSSETIGETLSKIITSLQSNPQLMASTEAMLTSVPGSGVGANISTLPMNQQITGIFGGLSSLLKRPGSSAEYSYILSQLGINSSAIPSANALFSTGGQAASLAASQAPANRASEEFKNQMDTLAGRLTQLRADFTNFGVSVLNSGLGKAITEAVDALGLFVRALTDINKDTGGLAGAAATIGAIVLAFKAMTTVIALTSGALRLLTGSATAAAAAEGAAPVEGAAAAGASGFLAGGITGAAATFARTAGPILGDVAAPAIGAYIIYKLAQAGLNYAGSTQRNVSGAYAANLANQTMDQYVQQHVAAINKNEPSNAHGLPVYVNGQWVMSGSSGAAMVPKGQKAANLPTQYTKAQEEAQANLMNQQQALNKYLAAVAAAQENLQQRASIMATDVQGVASAYSTGTIGQGEAVKLLSQNVTMLSNEFKSSPSAASWEAYLNALQTLDQQIDQTAQETLQTNQAILSNGNPQQAQNLANLAEQTAKNMKTPQDMLSALQTYVSAVQTAWQDTAANAGTGLARIQASTQSASIPQSIVSQLAKAGINVPGQISGFMSNPQQFQALSQDVQAAQQLAQAGAVEDPVKIAIANAQAAAANVQNALHTEGASSDDYKQAVASLEEANQQIVDAQNQVSQAKMGMLAAMFSNAPLQAAQYSLAQLEVALQDAHGAAQIDQIRGQIAQQQATMSMDAIQAADAVAGVSEAIWTSRGNPVNAALVAYHQSLSDAAAREQYDRATGTNMAQDTQLQQMIATSIQDQAAVFAAQISAADTAATVVEATLTAQGNPIAAALVKYQRDLADIAARRSWDVAMGANQSQDQTLQQMIAQEISDQTNYLQTQFSTLQQTTQNELYLGQITATQAIAQLQAGMAAAQGNALLVQQYEVAIRQIQNSAGANLNFDIPSNLLINPTLYQANRLAQTGTGQYNDNRRVTVTINMNSAASTPGAVNAILSAIGSPSTSGSVLPITSSALANPG